MLNECDLKPHDWDPKEILHNTDVINDLLIFKYPSTSEASVNCEPKPIPAIFVHTSIFDEFVQVMETKFNVSIIDHSYDYGLQVGTTIYDLKLVYVPKNSKDIDIFIKDFLVLGRLCMMLADAPNLFISQKRFYELKMFIHVHQLEPHIAGIETKPGLIYDITGDTNIIVVTFQKYINRGNLIQNFALFLVEHYTGPCPNYYQTVAFPWLQPTRIRHFSRPISSQSYFIVHQFLTCLRELSYDREPHANLFDLCNLKLAFCDDRGMNHWEADLAYEIDALIIRSLNKLKMKTNLFANNQFNLYKYVHDRNIMWNTRINKYFQYTFQDYFDSIKISMPPVNSSPDEHFETPKEIKLADHPDLEIVKQMSHRAFHVDCTNFDQMNLFKFINLLKLRNVVHIVLNTNHKWLDSNEPNYLLMIAWIIMLMESNKSEFKDRYIRLDGKNTYNFVEHFIFALKTFKAWPRLQLFLNSSLNNYAIFNETEFSEIMFCNITVDSRMLQQLCGCTFNSDTKCKLFQCNVQNERSNWDLICTMDFLDFIDVIEDESTVQHIFEFVAKQLKVSGLNEFTFTKTIYLIFNPNYRINLTNVTFVMDSTNSKIIMTEKDSNKQLDLYYLKNTIEFDDKSEYDFYN